MNQKILFVDLDATLLNDDATLSEGNREAVRRMIEAGHYIVLATGRTVEAGRIYARQLGLTMPGCYMIAFNGAVLYDCSADRVLFRRTLPIEVVQEIFERAERAGIYAQTFQKTDVVTKRHAKELDYYLSRTHLNYKLAPHIMEVLEEEPPKVMLIEKDYPYRLKKFRKDNMGWTRSRCSCFFSSQYYLEYCPLDANKAMGIQYLTKILNMPADCTIAVGDEQNDIMMIKTAHIGIAVKNAIPAAKDAADYVTENDNNHDAIAEVIERFVL